MADHWSVVHSLAVSHVDRIGLSLMGNSLPKCGPVPEVGSQISVTHIISHNFSNTELLNELCISPESLSNSLSSDVFISVKQLGFD